MAKITGLTEGEKEILRSSYLKAIQDADQNINVWEAKKREALARIADIQGEEKEPVGQQPLFKQIEVDIIPAIKPLMFNQKIYRTIKAQGKEMSTGEIYGRLILMFPEEASKNKTYHIQAISKKLKDGAQARNLYYLSTKKSSSGKLLYGLLEWKVNKE